MFKRSTFHVFSAVVISFSVLVSTEHGMDSSEQFDSPTTEENETSFSQELIENDTPDNETLFWAIPAINNTTEPVVSVLDTQQTESEKEDTTDVLQDSSLTPNDIPMNVEPPTQSSIDQTAEENQNSNMAQHMDDNIPSEMNEKIVLQRNNCNLEMAVHDTRDSKIQIKFEPLQNNTAGTCSITLNGHEGSMLAVFISNVHLYHNGSQGEVLKVIVKNYASTFVLKEYYGKSTYQPLLLTETHRVNIVLYYSVKTVTPGENYSYFNLEVFTYHKYENNIHDNPHQGNNYHSSYYHF